MAAIGLPQLEEAQDLTALVDDLRVLFEDPDFKLASEIKRTTGKPIVGNFPVYSPVELFHAAGAHPVGLVGAGNQIEIAHADSRFQSFVCSVIKSTLELGLTDRLRDFDGMVFHSICDPARNLASVFKRNFPDQWVEYIHFPQNLVSESSVDYLESEYRRILDRLSELTGKQVTNDDVNQSITLYNRARSLMRDLYAFRRDNPHVLTTKDLYTVVRAGHILTVEEHIRLLEHVQRLVQTKQGHERDHIRVILVGSFCEQPSLDLINAMEEAGLDILDDDFVLGRRWFTEDVRADGDGVRSLAEAYRDRSVISSVKHDSRRHKGEELVAQVRSAKADAVIVSVPKFCEPGLFDYAIYRRALLEANIPHLFVEYEEKMWLFDKVQTEVETFVESLLLD
jgi:benzoyl-CoA reductase subunit C